MGKGATVVGQLGTGLLGHDWREGLCCLYVRLLLEFGSVGWDELSKVQRNGDKVLM